jgi:hypothetical protein
MKFVYHIESPRDVGAVAVDDQIRWAVNEVEHKSQELLTAMRAAAGGGGTVELIETYIDVDGQEGPFGLSAPRVRVAVVVEVVSEGQRG